MRRDPGQLGRKGQSHEEECPCLEAKVALNKIPFRLNESRRVNVEKRQTQLVTVRVGSITGPKSHQLLKEQVSMLQYPSP
ncbi:hypothetical protein F9C07_2336 [Aspergillus flavus]|uniref:Uncharacterized protein n=1 Tax=Aspergillus flavus (strain ATCC 200026 / FGSC A1120 / IAM 13836 / NRRL 3357 / JCM 12722 / SRRC 167) TaxID=332952 RepID=A0A7U2QS00_ASPFN|nr:hypothetical protein AFLA70_199g001941 [Aspergillus flavus AF70]QRD82736.1 hypothetical protein F9C07_2336 [Aspergillus flavus]